MDDVFKRAWKYYRRNGWQRSMRMLRRKISGTAPVPSIAYLHAFEGVAGRYSAPSQGEPSPLPASDVARQQAAVFPQGIVAIHRRPQSTPVQEIPRHPEGRGIELDRFAGGISFWGDTPRSLNIMQCASAMIFYRMKDNREFRAYLSEARRLGVFRGLRHR